MGSKAKAKPAGSPAGSGSGGGKVIPDNDRGEVDLKHLREHPDNPRKTFLAAELEEMAASMRPPGRVDVRLIVRPVGPACEYVPGEGWKGVDHFQVLDGHKRFRAAKLAGLKAVPVDVVALDDRAAYVLMLRSFAQRSDPPASEQVAAYHRLAADGWAADQIAGETGKPAAYVRSVLRLAKLPGWALAAVDAGVLPRAVAEIVARVPGKESRILAAACVLRGINHPGLVTEEDWDRRTWTETFATFTDADRDRVLSYRSARELVRSHFTRQLSSAPFSRKSLELLPEAGSCDACPNRAGNDEEAKADGIRADCCLDPDCYRKKEDAYRSAEVAKLEAKGVLAADLDAEGFDRPPRGWCRLDAPANETELAPEFTGYNGTPLGKLLGDHCPQKYHGFARGGKVVLLVKTAEARKGLVEAGVLKKQEPVASGRDEPTTERAKDQPTKPAAPGLPDIVDKAADLAGHVLAEYAAEQCEALADIAVIPDADHGRPIHDTLSFVARWLIRDNCQYGGERADVVRAAFGLARTGARPSNPTGADTAALIRLADDALAGLDAAKLLAACLRLVSGPSLIDAVYDRPFGDELLAWAELDWEQLKSQARRELAGGQTADEKIAAAEAEPTPTPATKKDKVSA